MPSEHPNHDALRAYLKAELPPQQAAEMEAHLAGCDACVDVLAGLSEHEGIERRLKGLADAPARDSAAERRFLEELKARGPAEAARSPEASDQPTEAFPAAEQAVRLKCPHCGHGIQLVAPAPGEITCESCGSSFRVESAIAIAAPTGELPQTIGKFEILEQLGRGAFGAVYKARDRDLDRIVAVKVPRAGTFDTPEAEERFVREARSAAHLRHHNIVQVHEIAYERGVPYIVSEYIDGRTLADLVTTGRPGFRETAELVAQIADALDYAHRQKIIHRDIKPSNILVQIAERRERRAESRTAESGGQRAESQKDVAPKEAGDEGQKDSPALGSPPSALRPYLTDFGLARRDEGEITMTVEGQILGTPAYMSPEQAAGDQRNVDGRSDVYSLGVVLYELLTGERPFSGNKRMLLQQVMSDEPRPPRRLNDRIPRDLETICLKAMAKSPSRRYDTARELADDLRRWLKDEPIHARPVGHWERTARWCRRNPVVAGLLASLAVALLALAASGLLFAIRERAVADQERQTAGRERGLRQQAETAETQAQQARQAEATERQHAERRLARLYVERGQRALEQEDAPGALPWFIEALALEEHDAQRARTHRTRLAATLRQCATPVQVWNHPEHISHAEFSPDGRCILTASDKVTARGNVKHDGGARVWGVFGGGLMTSVLDGQSGVHFAAFNADATRFVTVRAVCTPGFFSPVTDQCEVRVWDTRNGVALSPPLQHDAKDWPWHAAFSPDGKILATAGGPPNGYPTTEGEKKWWTSMSPGSKGQVGPGELRLWDWATGTMSIPPVKFGQPIAHVAFRNDGRAILVNGIRGLTEVYDVTTGKPVGEAICHAGGVLHAELSPDGRQILTVGADRGWNLVDGTWQLRFEEQAAGQLFVWDSKTLELQKTLKGRVSSFTHGSFIFTHGMFSDHGGRILGIEGAVVSVWDVNSGNPKLKPIEHARTVTHATVSADGMYLATVTTNENAGLAEVRVWDISAGRYDKETGTPVGEARLVCPPILHPGPLSSIAFSPFGPYLLTAGGTTAWLWRFTPGAKLTPLDATGSSEIYRRPDQRFLATYSYDARRIQVWDVYTGQPVSPGIASEGSKETVALSRDGKRTLAISVRGKEPFMEVWDTLTGKPLFDAVRLPYVAWHKSVGSFFSRDYYQGCAWLSLNGERVVTAGRTTNNTADAGKWEARVWDASNGKPVTPPLLHSGRGVDSAWLSPNGGHLATVETAETADSGVEIKVGDAPSDCRILRIWNVSSGRQVAQVARRDAAHSDVSEVVCAPASGLVMIISRDYPRTRFEVWVTDTWQKTASWESVTRASRAWFSRDGRRIVERADQTVEVRDAATGVLLAEPLCLPDPLYAVDRARSGGQWELTVSRDATLVAFNADDRTAKVRSLLDGKPAGPPLVHSDVFPGRSLTFSPDDRWLATNAHGRACVWDIVSGEPVFLRTSDAGLDFTPDGRILEANRYGTQVLELDRLDHPLETLRNLGRLVAGRALDESAGFLPVSEKEPGEIFAQLQARLDGEYRPATEQALLWHAREAKLIAARIGPDPEHWEFADVATWHLGRLIEHGPRQASLFARRAACFYRIGDFASALADYSTAIALAPDASAHYGRGNCLAELGRWAEARAEFRRAAEAQHDMSHALSQLAFAHLAARDDVGFRSVCDEILKCVSQFKTPDDPSAAAWTCLLIPGIANDSAQIQALVDRCSELYWLYSRPVHALADYRRGDFEQVIQRINKRWEHNEVDPRYQEWLLMAMAHHKLGRRSEAHQWFQKAADWIKENAERNDQQPTDYFLTWDQRLELSVLHAEAESLMKEGE